MNAQPDGADATSAAPRSGPIWGRVAITCLAPALAEWLCPKVPLPGLDHAHLALTFPELAASERLSAFALWLSPVLSAFLLVELVALCVPRWRSLRNGGPQGRGRLLTATWKLALALAAVQAWGLAVYLERMGLLADGARLSRLLVVLSLVAGTCSFVVLARWLDVAGLGGGFSVLALFGFLRPGAFGDLDAAFAGALAEPSKALPAVAVAALACAATVLLLRGRRRDPQGRPSPVRLPACGIVPFQQAAAMPAFVAAGASLGLWSLASSSFGSSDGLGAMAFRAALTVALACVWSVVFNLPANVVALDVRAAQPADAAGQRQVHADLRWALLWSAAYTLALGLADWLVPAQLDLAPALNVLLVAVATAVTLDVVAEARARRRLGDLEPVWPEHRLYAVDRVLATLEQAGIPAFPRSANHRALWHVFAPFIPIQILVPSARAREASELLHERFATR